MKGKLTNTRDLQSVNDVLEYWAAHTPDKMAYKFLGNGEIENRSITYRQLYDRVLTLASAFLQNGKKGDRALLIYPSGIEFIEAYLACLKVGIIAVPVILPSNSRRTNRLNNIISDSRPDLILSTEATIKKGYKWFEKNPIIRDSTILSTDLIIDGVPIVNVPIELDDLAFLQYTSGSTGVPKGVMITHGNLIYNLQLIEKSFGISSNDVMVGWLPVYHDMGLIGNILGTLYVGGTYVFMDPISFIRKPIRWLKAISKYNASVSGGPNFGFDLCANKIMDDDMHGLDLSSWKIAFNGAEPIQLATLNDFSEKFKPYGFKSSAFFPCYGMAEATLLVSGSKGNYLKKIKYVNRETNSYEDDTSKDQSAYGRDYLKGIVSSGKVPNEIEVKIIDTSTQTLCEENQIGEIWIAGKSISPGYWDKESLNQKAFNKKYKNQSQIDNSNYFRTGDIGFLQQGHLYISGRVKEMIIYKGQNYFPQDIEQSIQQDNPDLENNGGVVFGVEKDCEEAIVIVQEINRASHRNYEANKIFEAINNVQFSEYGLPVNSIILVKPGSIPKTSSGKIQRTKVKEWFLNDTIKGVLASWKNSKLTKNHNLPKNYNTSEPLSKEDLKDWLKIELSSYLEIDENSIKSNTSFAQLGITSVQIIQLSGSLSDYLKKEISPTLLYSYTTIDDLVDFVYETKEETSSKKDIKVDSKTKIAVIAATCRFPGAENINVFLENLKQGRDSVTEVPKERWNINKYYDRTVQSNKTNSKWGGFIENVDTFDTKFFGISPGEATFMDPQQRVLLEQSYHLFENAGYTFKDLENSRTGVFIGISQNNYSTLLLASKEGRNLYSGTGNALSVAANRISYFYDLKGPSLVIDTACSSSLAALHTAIKSIQDGSCTMAIAGGVNLILTPDLTIAMSQGNMLSEDGCCKVFDASANGYVRGEGCGLVLLKPIEEAENDGDEILGVILGSAINQDGKSNGLTAPNGKAQEAVIKDAIKNANIKPSQVDYVETHGTGTSLGDPIEVNALKTVYFENRTSENPLKLGSVKSNIGHLESAAGIAGFIKALLCVKHGIIPKQLHYKTPNPHIEWDSSSLQVPTETISWEKINNEPRIAGISSFGFGGVNTHVILQEAPEKITISGDDSSVLEKDISLMPISAKQNDVLDVQLKNMLTFLSECPNIDFKNIEFNLALKRNHFSKRSIILAIPSQVSSLTQKDINTLLLDNNIQIISPNLSGFKQKVAFMFTGGGAQFPGMGYKLYSSENVFKKALDECLAIANNYLEYDLGSIIFSKGDSDKAFLLNRIDYMQPALFAFEYAVFCLWKSWGVTPNVLIGHSLGEIVAATVAEVFSLEDGLKLVCARGKLMNSLSSKGLMVSIQATKEEVSQKIKDFERTVSIGVINNPLQIVISGAEKDVLVIKDLFDKEGIKTKVLQVSHASHSPMMKPIVSDYEKLLKTITLNTPTTNIVGNITGAIVTDEMCSIQYWIDHLIKPVQFSSCIETAEHMEVDTYVEVGPNPVLLGIAGSIVSNSESICWLPSSREDEEDLIYKSLAQWYVEGGDVRWEHFNKNKNQKTQLPNYPFVQNRYWIEHETDPLYPNRDSANVDPIWEIAEKKDVEGLKELINTARLTYSNEVDNALPEFLSLLNDYKQRNREHELFSKLGYSIDLELWKKAPQKTTKIDSSITWLVLSDSNNSFSTLIDHIRSLGGKVISLTLKDILEKTDFIEKEIKQAIHKSLFQILKQERSINQQIRVLNLWGLDVPTFNSNPNPNGFDLHTYMLAIIYSVIGIDEHSASKAIQFYFITKNGCHLRNSFVDPHQFTIQALSKVVAIEYPDLWGGTIDISENFEDNVNEIIELVNDSTHHDHYTIINSDIYVQRLNQFPLFINSSQDWPTKGSILITGGLGDLGIRLTHWLSKQGAKDIILLSRNSDKPNLEYLVKDVEKQGCKISIVEANVSDIKEMSNVFSSFTNIKIIFHLAGILHDSLLINQTRESFERVFEAKVKGATVLHELTKDKDIEEMIFFSSASAIFGNIGQSNYSSANSFIDGLTHLRSKQGLPARTINWSVWEAGGLVNRDHENTLFSSGFNALKSDYNFEVINQMISQDIKQLLIADINLDVIKNLSHKNHFEIFNNLVELPISDKDVKSENIENEFLQSIQHFTREKQQQIITDKIQFYVAKSLNIEDPKSLDRNSNLFELGMDSLMVTELKNTISRTVGRSIPLKVFFTASNINELASITLENIIDFKTVDPSRSFISSLPKRLNNKEIPLSSMQQRLWFLDNVITEKDVYNICFEIGYKGRLSISTLNFTIYSLIQRHESLRSKIVVKNGVPNIKVGNAWIPNLAPVDLSALSGKEKLESLSLLRKKEMEIQFDFSKPAVSFLLIKLSEEEYKLSITMHHIFTDGWSLALLLKEIIQVYDAFEKGHEFPLESLQFNYSDFTLWEENRLQSEAFSAAKKYWGKTLDNIPKVNLPISRPYPAHRSFKGDNVLFEIPENEVVILKKLAKENDTTLFNLLLSVYSLLLHRYSGQEDFGVGTFVANRNFEGSESILGFLGNTIVVRMDLSANPTFNELLRRTQNILNDSFEHQEFPFNEVVKLTSTNRTITDTPLYNVYFVLDDFSLMKSGKDIGKESPWQVINTKVDGSPEGKAKDDMGLIMMENQGKLVGEFNYNTDVLNRGQIEKMLEHLKAILKYVASNSEATISETEMLSERERSQLIRDFNATYDDTPVLTSVLQLFKEKAQNIPNEIAIVSEDSSVTYRELDQRSDALANYLITTYNVLPNDPVAIMMERSELYAVSILGILKAGGAYVPIDSNYPLSRKKFILEDTQAKLLIITSQDIYDAMELNVNMLSIDIQEEEINNKTETNTIEVDLNSLAYIIYTSGSTGNPKGVLIPHKNLAASTRSRMQYYGVIDATFLIPSFAFDSSIAVFWWTLLSGGVLHVPKNQYIKDPVKLRDILHKDSIDTILCVPSYYNVLLDDGLLDHYPLKRVVVAGEKLDRDLVKKHYDTFTDVPLYNEYGPTESTVWSSVAHIKKDDAVISIGTPIPTVKNYILDTNNQVTPIGVLGELHIGGPQVAKGYLNRDDLTTTKFIPDPFSDSKDARLYKTGDIARWLSNGEIEYLGRNDNQIKIHGYRIELGEIESVLEEFPGTKQVVVLPKENKETTTSYLIAYVVQEKDLDKEEMQRYAKSKLPEYMIPSIIIEIDEIPLTPNGKVDKKALPESDTFLRSDSYVSPRNELEQKLANVWQKVLNIEKVGINDNFFELGGHSLLAIKLISEMNKEIDIDIDMKALFKLLTISAISDYIQVADMNTIDSSKNYKRIEL